MPRRLFNDSGDYQTFRAKGKRYKNHRRGGLKTARDQRHPTQETDERATWEVQHLTEELVWSHAESIPDIFGEERPSSIDIYKSEGPFRRVPIQFRRLMANCTTRLIVPVLLLSFVLLFYGMWHLYWNFMLSLYELVKWRTSGQRRTHLCCWDNFVMKDNVVY